MRPVEVDPPLDVPVLTGVELPELPLDPPLLDDPDEPLLPLDRDASPPDAERSRV